MKVYDVLKESSVLKKMDGKYRSVDEARRPDYDPRSEFVHIGDLEEILMKDFNMSTQDMENELGITGGDENDVLVRLANVNNAEYIHEDDIREFVDALRNKDMKRALRYMYPEKDIANDEPDYPDYDDGEVSDGPRVDPWFGSN